MKVVILCGGLGTRLREETEFRPTCILEQQPLNRLAAEQQIAAYVHGGFWQCMDTYREQQLLSNMWTSGNAPWKVW